MPGVRFIIIICTVNNRLKIVSDDGIQITLVPTAATSFRFTSAIVGSRPLAISTLKNTCRARQPKNVDEKLSEA